MLTQMAILVFSVIWKYDEVINVMHRSYKEFTIKPSSKYCLFVYETCNNAWISIIVHRKSQIYLFFRLGTWWELPQRWWRWCWCSAGCRPHREDSTTPSDIPWSIEISFGDAATGWELASATKSGRTAIVWVTYIWYTLGGLFNLQKCWFLIK